MNREIIESDSGLPAFVKFVGNAEAADIAETSDIADVDIVGTVFEKSIEIIKLTKDVFVSAYDLVLLDRSHAIFGGSFGSADEWDAIQSVLDEMYGVCPMGWTDNGSCFFLPGLSMDSDVGWKLSMMSEADQVRFYVKVKRALVNSWAAEMRVLDRQFWIEMIGDPIDFKKGSIPGDEMDDRVGRLFLGERYLHRFGGNARALDDIVEADFNMDDAVAKVRALVSRLPVDALKHHDQACGEYRLITM